MICTAHWNSRSASARVGLRYTNFHVTAMCSPTRCCLLTGRNHHAAGMGYLADFDTGFDNARGAIAKNCATLAEMLRGGGYATYATGKWHLTPPSQMSPTGPFDQWPTQRGFDRFYGFLGGEEDQWAPELWYDQHHVPPPDRDGYHLSEDLVSTAEQIPAKGRRKSRPLGVCSVLSESDERFGLGVCAGGSGAALAEALAVAVHLEDVDVVGQPVEQCAGEAF